MATERKMILSGIRVVDCSRQLAGSAGAAFLTDLGADVIKIEQRGSGEPLRGWTHAFGVPLALPKGRSAVIEYQDRNKRSISLDLSKPAGREVIYKLVEKSDVFVTNMLPSVRRQLSIDYETVSRYNSKLVYASGSIYGDRGPDAETPAWDLLAQARSGIMMATGENSMRPVLATSSAGDILEAFLLAYGVIGALLARERLGVGQEVSVSQLGGLMSIVEGWPLTLYLWLGETGTVSRTKPPQGVYNWYRCKDGRWLAIAAHMGGNRYWSPLCKALGIAHLENDPRFVDMEQRKKNSEELVRIFDRIFETKTCAEWESIFRETGEIPFSRVNEFEDLLTDPQVVENKFIVEFDHPVLGPIKVLTHPAQFSKTPATVRWGAPEYGQNTEEVLLEVCGYDWARIEELKKQEVI